ncbi:ABC transporter C family member 5 [Sesbania bispinosa]|nr:ABC transporter C family member 5 [Sesbania bispinosa]
MDSKFKHGSFEYINLDGKNVGATMRLQHRSSTKGEPKEDCCCINIYVNNNVQGVSNSVLHDSEVRMRDPGISLYFENLKCFFSQLESSFLSSEMHPGATSKQGQI